MIDADADPRFVASSVVNAVRDDFAEILVDEVVNAHGLRLARTLPFVPAVFEIAHQFLLFRVDGHDGLASLDEVFRGAIDVLELLVAVRRLLSFSRLAHDLKTEAEIVQQPSDDRRAHLVAHRLKLGGELVFALARPAQRRLGIASRRRVYERVEIAKQRGVLHDQRRPSSTRPTNALRTWRLLRRMLLQLREITNARTDSRPADSGRFQHRVGPAVADRLRFGCRPKTRHALIHHAAQLAVLRSNRIHVAHAAPTAHACWLFP